jgi:hypothetical protein
VVRRHRLGVPALLITCTYALAVAVAAVLALTAGDLGGLWRLTMFTEVDEDVAVTWPNVLILVVASLPCAWALWQSLRGPLAGPPPELDRDTSRLRAALYVAAAFWLPYALLTSWPWWLVALEAVAMWVVVVLFQPLVAGELKRADHVRAAGVLGYGGLAAVQVLDVVDLPVPGWLPALCGLAVLLWTALILRAQWRSDRWHLDTVMYGVASMVAPFVLVVMSMLLAPAQAASEQFAEAANVFALIWLARSAHDLADPGSRPAPPLSAEPAQDAAE